MKWPTMDEFAQMVADKAIDEIEYNGKTLREWIEIISATELGTNLAEVGTDVPDTNVGDKAQLSDKGTTFENGGEIKRWSKDIISRQAAIDALDQIYDRCEEIEAHLPEGDPDRTGYKMYPDYMTVWKYLHQLPSAQPVITCDGCKFVGTYDTDFPCCNCIIREKDYYAQE